ncbi:MAG: hypothetical protein R3F18_12055 [Lysobacterales bacterium]
MRLMYFAWALLLASGSVCAQGLVPGQSTQFNLPASSYTNSLYFDVPAGASRIRVELESDTSNVDLDLFMRYGNSFSSQTPYGRPMDFDALQDQAQYFAVSASDEETISVGRSNYRPVQAGRWHLAILNFATIPVDARIKVEVDNTPPTPVQFDVRFDLPGAGCDVAPWNDPAPATPVGGNPGTTLGQQRRNAMIEALRQLGAGFDSEIPITVRACWDDLTVGTNTATLAAAAPDDFLIADRSLVFSDGSGFRPAPFLPDKYAFYSAAPAARLGGTRGCSLRGGSCADSTDMTITYNRRIGSSGVLGGNPFYLGYGAAPPGTLDFVGVSVHELGHGLGFLSLVRVSASGSTPIGAKPLGRDDIYARQVIDTRAFPYRPFLSLTDAERADALTSRVGISWNEARAVNSPENIPTGFPGILLYAPNPIQGGSTLSHLSDGYLGQLMTPSLSLSQGTRQLGLAVPMLYAMGWAPEPAAVPVNPAPYAGLWYDRDRDGHGVDFQRIYTDAAGFDIYSLIFYSFDSDGRPEWYIAIGPLVDGVFAASLDPAGNSLVRYRYVGGATPQQAVPSQSGKVVLDFNKAESSPACNDGTARPGVGLLGMFRYTLGGATGSWCMEELIPAAARPAGDLTGTWYAGSNDAGWGSSVANAAIDASQRLLFSTLYYPDSTGAGRWAFVSSSNYQPGQSLPVIERRGYCRSCPVSLTDTQIGTLTPTLTQATQGQAGSNRLSFDVSYGGPEGGRFTRDVPYELLSVPQ